MRFKKSVKGETGQAKKYHKWPWSSQMEFLDDTLKFRPPNNNISDMSIGSPSGLETPPEFRNTRKYFFSKYQTNATPFTQTEKN
jgi:hypothetical protein